MHQHRSVDKAFVGQATKNPERVAQLALEDLAVFIADDDDAYRESLRTRLLDEFGLRQVACARDGVSGLQWWARRDFDPHLIFADLHMPRMGGLQFARLLHLRGNTGRVYLLHVGEAPLFWPSARTKDPALLRMGSLQKNILHSVLHETLRAELRGSREFAARVA